MAETARQEIDLSLGGVAYVVRPDFATLANIEAQTGQAARSLGLKALAAILPANQRGGFSEISVTELATVLFWMLRGKKNAPASIADIGNMLMDEGCAQFFEPVGEFLVRAHRGNKEHMKEAAQENAPEDPPAQA